MSENQTTPAVAVDQHRLVRPWPEIDERTAGFIEGYATALKEVELRLTGENGCSKTYDPMTVADGQMYSYAFDMKDGGRHHCIADYKDLTEVKLVLFREFENELVDQVLIEPNSIRSPSPY